MTRLGPNTSLVQVVLFDCDRSQFIAIGVQACVTHVLPRPNTASVS